MTSQTTRAIYGNIVTERIYKNTTYAAQTSSASSFQGTFLLPGISTNDLVFVIAPFSAPVTGVAPVSAYVSAKGIITVQFLNTTGGSVTTTAATAAKPYYFKIIRIDGNLPTDVSNNQG